jgi:hypothetical protein
MVLSWDLVSPVTYTAGEELSFNLHFEAPVNTEADRYYLLGALYSDTSYISGSLFGILKPADVDYGVNDPTYMSVWELEPEQAVDLPCRFTFDRSDVILGLFLMKMLGTQPSLDADEQVASVSVQLSSQALPTPPMTIESVLPMVVVVMMFGMLGLMMYSIKGV